MSEFLKEYIVPNYYTKEHFDVMEDWSEEQVNKFKEFMGKAVCAHDPFKEIISEYIEHFNGLNKLAWIMGLSNVSELTEETVSAFRNVREAYFEDKEAVLAEFEKRDKKRDRKKKASKKR